ncbi:MAG: T9SS type A sorting domain-containing protein [Bacteroidetes bacterium]|nr:T9SS type A sorting domain-containing protein [Bacteroidota bacterium]
MKKLLFLLIATFFLATSSWAQLTGIKTIPGTTGYNTIKMAIDSLNAKGVGTEGVKFNITTGHTEIAPSGGFVITATGTAVNPIIFQRNGTGVNPIITAGIGTGTTDAIIKITGGDYITFDGIDLKDTTSNTTATTQMEWGYALVKKQNTAPFDGCQFVTIKNCSISLNKSNTVSVGIYAGNHIATATTALTITATTDAMNNCKFFNNIISNVYSGISVTGYGATTNLTLYDSNNEIGVDGANIITNLGGGSAIVRGIFVVNQKGLKVANNIINSSIAGLTGAGFGIFTTNGTSSNVDIYNNTITLTAKTGTFTSTLTAISNTMGSTAASNTVNIYNNTISNCNLSAATSGSFIGISNTGAAATVNIYGNIINGDTLAGTGSFTGINNSAVMGTNPLNIYSNVITNNAKTGASGNMYCTQANTATIDFYSNIIHDNSATGTTTFYGYYNFSAAVSETYRNNTIYNLTHSGTGTLIAFNDSTSTGTKNIFGNTIYSLNSGGNVTGMFFKAATVANIYKNNIYNLSTSGSASQSIGITYTGTTGNIYNNYISDIKATASSHATGVIGINLGGNTQNLYYNTIYLNAISSSSTTFGSAGIYKLAVTVGDFRNNIIANNSTAGSTGFTTAFRLSGIYTASNYAATSNYNCFYAGTPSTSNLIFYDGTNASQVLDSFKTIATGRDIASISQLPPFVNTTSTPYNLHLQTTISTGCESGGIRITSPAIADDFDGNIRWGEPGYTGTGSTTDIGANEFEGKPIYTCTTPNPGNSVASANTLCLGNSTVLSLQNLSSGTGINYQWKSSIDSITYTNISGATASTYTATPLTPTFYKCDVTCPNGPITTTSNPVKIIFSSSIASTTPGSRCNSGTVSLAATANGTGTLVWHTTAFGGAPIGTGSPFTTPTITATTDFYVGTETYSPNTAIAIGAGASTSSGFPNPFYSDKSNIHTQHLITAAQLQAAGLSAGNITSVALDVTSIGTLPMINLSVKIGTTTATSLTTFASNTSFSTVYTNASLMPTLGSNVLTFTTPFNWDGVSNIVLEFCHGNASSTAAMNRTIKTDATAYVSSIKTSLISAADSATICSDVASNLVSYSECPKFVFTGRAVCSSPRAKVSATITPAPVLSITANQTICNNTITSLKVISDTNSYNSYIWTPSTGLYTNSTATTAYVAGASATTVYVKSATPVVTTYTCSASNAFFCANTATSTVAVLPASPTITAVSSPICGSGRSLLSVSPSTGYGDATFQWKSSSDSITFTDIIGHTTLNDTTAIISSKTYYQLIIKDGTGNTCVQPSVSVAVNNPQVLTTAGANRCGPGTVNLAATASSGTTLRWYSTSTGGSSIGTGTSFTTPIITSNTDYYVAADFNNTATTATIGNGIATAFGTYTPFCHTYGGSKTQYLFTAAELTSANIKAGSINGLSLFVTAMGITYNGFYIQIGNTTLTNFTSTANILGGLTTVYNSASLTPTVGTNSYTFSTPFIWDGTSNIVISLSWSNTNGGGSSATVKVDPTTNYSSQGYNKDNETSANMLAFTGSVAGSGTLSTSQNRPQIRFNYTPICSSARSTVSVIYSAPPILSLSANQTICSNSISSFSVTSPLANFSSYTWVPITYLYTDSLCTIPYTASASATKVYAKPTSSGKIDYTCTANNSSSLCSNSATVTLTINPTPTALAITPSSSTICPGIIQPLTTNGGTITNAVLFSENFNGTTNNWTTSNTSTGTSPTSADWKLTTDGYFYSSYGTWHSNDNSQFYMSNSNASGTGSKTTTTLISPSFNTTGFSSLALKFWHYYRYNTDSAMVEISTDSSVSWTPLKVYKSTQGNISAFVRDSIDFSSYINQPNVKIRFNYYDAAGYFWGIDNVSITGNQNTSIVWSPITGLFADTAATIPYLTGTSASKVYSKPTSNITYNIIATNAVLCSSSGNSSITVNALPANAGGISGTTSTVCQGESGFVYNVPTIAGATSYTWLYSGSGAIISTSSNSATVNYSATGTTGNLTVAGHNTCGDGVFSANFPITVNPIPVTGGTISGTASVCQGATNIVYSVPAIDHATSYEWSYSGTGANFTPITNTDSVIISFTSTATLGNLKVRGKNACGNGLYSANYFITVNPFPSAAGTISGSATVCHGYNNVVYTVPAINSATSYIWSYSGTGVTYTANTTTNTVSISFSATATIGNLTVFGRNACGDGIISASFPITFSNIPAAAGTITGTSVVCQGQNNVAFSVPAITNATSYNWSYSGAGATYSGNSNNITISFLPTASSGNLTVSGHSNCGDGIISASYPITINLLPVAAGTISGTASVCQGVSNITYTVPAISNALTYTWAYSGSGVNFSPTTTTNNNTINFLSTATSGNLTVKGHNACGDGIISANYFITVNITPDAAGAITGNAAVCAGETNITYHVPTISGANSYVWNYSGTGASFSPSATTNADSVTISFSTSATTGSLTVKGQNNCGYGVVSANYLINVNGIPAAAGTIIGPTTVCQGQDSIIFKVPSILNATSYIWSYSGAGASFTPTTTEDSVKISFSPTATQGNLTVKGYSICGNGILSTNHAIHVNPLPGNAGVITGPQYVYKGYSNIKFSVPVISGASSYVWSYSGTGVTFVPPSGITTNDTIWLNFSSTATSGNLTVTGQNSCGDGAVSQNAYIAVFPVGIDDLGNSLNFQIYPNPSKGIITVNINDINSNLDLQITNIQGKVIHKETLTNDKTSYTQDIDLTSYPKGIYFVKIINKDFTKVEKIVLQ